MRASTISQKRNNQHKRNNKIKSRRIRKTYSIFSNSKKIYSKQQGRKCEYDKHNVNEPARRKIENIALQHESVLSESDEELDHMSQLRFTFKCVNKNDKTADSNTEGESDEENINDNQPNEQSQSHIITINKDAGDIQTFINNDDEKEIADNVESEIEIFNINASEEEDNIQESNINLIDSFAKHLFYDLSHSLLNSVQTVPMNTTNFTEEWPCLGTLIIQIPSSVEEKQEKNHCLVIEEKVFAPPGKIPNRVHLTKTTLDTLCIKSQIVNNVSKSNTSLVNKNKAVPLTALQAEIFSILNNYQDLYYPKRTFDNCEEIRYVYCLHALNHILKTRTKVIHHNARLSNKDDVPEEFRDQGLVRSKILILVPFRDSVYRIIQFLINILMIEDKGNVINKKRFIEDFTGNELIMPKKNPKPEDYELTFAGNSGDDFKIGITVTKKSLKLYADFYSSDIIIASPLGLRYVIGAEGESERNYDFLASIELLIFDQAEVFLMQNWDHVLHILNHMHLQPKESHGTDFSRVRTWSLNGWAKYYRQTLIFSSVVLPEINAIFNKRCFNYAGKIKVVKKIEHGSIRQVYVQFPHIFQKIHANSAEHSIDARLNFFVNKILPQQKDALMKQTLLYIPSYFDYVKIRNYFKKEDISFVQICEYSKHGKIARARDIFFHGDAHFLLYTERHHFFNRIRIKGIRHLIFYQPPNFPNFYYEICNFMQEANMNKKIGSICNMSITVLYTKYDVQQLAAIVGTDRATKMIQSEKSVHLLVTDAD